MDGRVIVPTAEELSQVLHALNSPLRREILRLLYHHRYNINEIAAQRFWKEVVSGTERQFVAEKLAERNARHKRMGDSRYVVEPNVKDGKGGLRDLQTVIWVARAAGFGRKWQELAAHGLKVWAISTHLLGQAVCEDPIAQRHQDILPGHIWGDGDPEGVRELGRINPWSADPVEGRVCAAADGDVGGLDHSDAGVQGGFGEVAEVG